MKAPISKGKNKKAYNNWVMTNFFKLALKYYKLRNLVIWTFPRKTEVKCFNREASAFLFNYYLQTYVADRFSSPAPASELEQVKIFDKDIKNLRKM